LGKRQKITFVQVTAGVTELGELFGEYVVIFPAGQFDQEDSVFFNTTAGGLVLGDMAQTAAGIDGSVRTGEADCRAY
jgi:hypothetical protein